MGDRSMSAVLATAGACVVVLVLAASVAPAAGSTATTTTSTIAATTTTSTIAATTTTSTIAATTTTTTTVAVELVAALDLVVSPLVVEVGGTVQFTTVCDPAMDVPEGWGRFEVAPSDEFIVTTAAFEGLSGLTFSTVWTISADVTPGTYFVATSCLRSTDVIPDVPLVVTPVIRSFMVVDPIDATLPDTQ